MPENADSWKCNKGVDQGKVAKYARCKLICQEGYDLSKSKRRDFHICKRTGSWMTTENVILSCKPNGDFFAEKLRTLMNQIQSFEVDVESLTRLVQKRETETDQCQEESEKCTEEKEIWTEKYDSLKTDLQECSSNRHDSLQPAGHVGISVIRRVENARETDTCIGTETNSGYITSKACCQADQMFLFEFENSTEIAIEENSIWIEEHICFINITSTFKFHFPILDDADTQNCTILAFDNSQGELIGKQIEVETKNSVDSFYSLKTDFLDNSMVLDGTLISCNGSSNFGIVSKSK